MTNTLARLCLAVFALTAFAGQAAPKLSIEQIGVCRRIGGCEPSFEAGLCVGAEDQARLTIATKPPIRRYYCSDYGALPGRIVTDRKGRLYLLLKYGDGHGTEVNVTQLAVYRIDHGLTRRGSFQLSDWIGPETRARYRYTVKRPARGGLVLRFTRYFDGKHIAWKVPPRTGTLRID